MKQAVIEFHGHITVFPGDEYDGEETSMEDARGWVWHALSRGDKHASGYLSSGGPVAVTYEHYDEEE
ncbi:MULTISPECIES: hypothetical protein [unclassified Streptomyces]|uniref:hypothetical protein n=1 Tax=unclassified Streptomyces TaxID=2593676 RepID=UPI0033C76E10